MPGKVNPVMPELVGLVAFRVMANDLAVTLAAKTGQLQLNAYEPLVGLAVLESQSAALAHARRFAHEVRRGHPREHEDPRSRSIRETVGIVTALNPVIGYERASELAAEAYRSGKGILEMIREKKILTEAQINGSARPREAHGARRRRLPEEIGSEKEAVHASKTARLVSGLLLVLCCPRCRPVAGRPASSRPSVVLATGGTIAGAAASDVQAGYTSGQVGVEQLLAAVPQAKKLANMRGRADREHRLAGHERRGLAEAGQARSTSCSRCPTWTAS